MGKNKGKTGYIVAGMVVLISILSLGFMAPTKAKGFMWKATKNDKDIYLVGTMHPAKKGIDYLNDTLKDIISNTDVLALEIDVFTNEEIINESTRLAKEESYLKEGELKDGLTSIEQKKLDEVLESFNLKYEDVSNMTFSGLLSLIRWRTFNELGFNGETTDEYLADLYQNKEIVSLETTEVQSNYLSDISEDGEELKELLKEFNYEEYIAEMKSFVNEEMDAYINGDEKYKEKSLEDLPKETYDANKVRNINMANEIDKLLKEDERYVIAVGNSHFFGNDSIIKELEKKGYKIEKLS